MNTAPLMQALTSERHLHSECKYPRPKLLSLSLPLTHTCTNAQTGCTSNTLSHLFRAGIVLQSGGEGLIIVFQMDTEKVSS